MANVYFTTALERFVSGLESIEVSGGALAFGTTTGNLYLSEDRGESWVCLSQNLPMVHSLEFV